MEVNLSINILVEKGTKIYRVPFSSCEYQKIKARLNKSMEHADWNFDDGFATACSTKQGDKVRPFMKFKEFNRMQ